MDCETTSIWNKNANKANLPASIELMFGREDELEVLEVEMAERIAEQLKGGEE